MSVLVDSSVWIEYFRGSGDSERLEYLIEENIVVVNDLILAELIPALYLRKQHKLIDLMREISCPALDVDWGNLVLMQTECLRHGINKVGIPDLIIAQHAIQNHLELYSLDKHFLLIAKHVALSLY